MQKDFEEEGIGTEKERSPVYINVQKGGKFVSRSKVNWKCKGSPKREKQRITLMRLVILSISVMIFTIGCSNQTQYQKNVGSFTPVSIEEVHNKIENRTPFVLYISNESCPFCVEVVNNVRGAAKEVNVKIFYIDSEDPDIKNDEAFLKFKEEYDAETDPTMLLFTENGHSKAWLITDTDEIAFVFKKYLAEISG